MKTRTRLLRLPVLAAVLMASTLAAQATIEAETESTLSPKLRQRLASYRADAMKGDYHAMRNIGLVWAVDSAQERPSARIMGCAWFMAVLDVHQRRANASDVTNKQTHCGPLNGTQLADANGMVQRIKWATVRH